MANDPRDEYGRNPAFWLAQELKRVRGETPRRKVAEILDVDQSTLQRLETGKRLRNGSRLFTFPPGFERYLAGYAQATGEPDGRDILLEAVKRWIRQGAPPLARLDDPDYLGEAAQEAARLAQQPSGRTEQSEAGKAARDQTRPRRKPGR